MTRPIVGLGAGAHARALIEALATTGAFVAVAVADDDEELVGGELHGVPVVATRDLPSCAHAFVGVGGIKDAAPRTLAFRRLAARGYQLPPIVHASATVSPRAALAAGAQILAAAVVNAGATVGEGAIVNTGAIVEHDCVIGPHTHIAPGATLGGSVTVGEGAHIGLGACILQEVTIGAGALIGAGAVVLHDVPAGMWVVGVPAHPIRDAA